MVNPAFIYFKTCNNRGLFLRYPTVSIRINTFSYECLQKIGILRINTFSYECLQKIGILEFDKHILAGFVLPRLIPVAVVF